MKNATTERPAGAAPTFVRLDGPAVAADPQPFARAYEQCYAHAAQLSDHSDPPIGDRLIRHGDRPGFELLAAMDGERVAGYIYGYTLPVDTLWWDGLAPAPAPELIREWPGRTVGVCELLVGRPWRRSQLGAQLFDGFLRGRTEERAAALVAEGNDVILDRCEKYGFAHVGTMEPYPGWRPHHMVVRSLRTG
ncbi:hypothetical protein MTQ01_19510 [Streptomyces sp. XM4193]|uniref:hypothetical protein n=1 Tax=Streptomyces sp. XM4193 TaxID=2929782 RepID=UPI001FFB76BD|nr:hypothetical protein [Streptomyces sp. XM4193]MCK1798173.1 hypothetical protein [Streptomyces sp. XM4193]